MDNLSNKC
ncbi:hypothetical protein F383_38520 [Gossypium arboreum]|uniref:Uncharacterized protein n=1 Tax=Gossypium arboreum TaxID=29729 RepID=A0A0B0MKU0_GOSAR|nr:hypothetical protein F383_38520 [Gossypium arboreum]